MKKWPLFFLRCTFLDNRSSQKLTTATGSPARVHGCYSVCLRFGLSTAYFRTVPYIPGSKISNMADNLQPRARTKQVPPRMWAKLLRGGGTQGIANPQPYKAFCGTSVLGRSRRSPTQRYNLVHIIDGLFLHKLINVLLVIIYLYTDIFLSFYNRRGALLCPLPCRGTSKT